MTNLFKLMLLAAAFVTSAASCSDNDSIWDQKPSTETQTHWVMTDAANSARQIRLSEAKQLLAAEDGSSFNIICTDGSVMHALKTVNIGLVETVKPVNTRVYTVTRADETGPVATGDAYVQFTITRTDSSTVNLPRRSLDITQDGEDDNWKIGGYSVDDITSITVSLGTDGYTAPQYPDNYVDAGLAGWDMRPQWNLANVHDPSVMLADDGYFYMYTTDASYGNVHSGHGHFFCRRSKNLVDWEFVGPSMPALPSWVKTKLNEIRKEMGLSASTADFNDETQFGFWAPCARKVKTGLYRMYYSITVPGNINGADTWSERAFIGMMETTDPASNKWEDKGYVITNVSDRELNFNVKPTDYDNCYFKFNAIDPSYIITGSGEHWLVYGSWHSGIAAVQLDAETGLPAKEPGKPWGSDISAYGKRIFTRNGSSRWQASEGPEVVYHDGYYYLFLAYDALDVPYNTRVVRSKNIDGPYENMLGQDVTDGGEALPMLTHPYKMTADDHGWVGISHCAVFDDGKGGWFYASQQRFPGNWNGNQYSNAIMQGGVRRIIWTDDGWPVVMPECYGGVPERIITETEIIGKTFRHIAFSYSYGKQCEAVSLTLGADHTISSSWNDGAVWSFDEASQTLTIAGVKLYLARETDWEASDRHATIVYSGLNSSKGMPYWGKME